jgi:hypothetical protein
MRQARRAEGEENTMSFWKSDVTIQYPDDSIEVRHAAINAVDDADAERIIEGMVEQLHASVVDIQTREIVPGSDEDRYIDVSRLAPPPEL